MAHFKFWHREKRSDLRRQWLMNTITVTVALGLVCVTVITAIFTVNHRKQMESDLRNWAGMAAGGLAPAAELEQERFYAECTTFVSHFDLDEGVQVQFVNPQGMLIAASQPIQKMTGPNTPEIAEAVSSRGICAYTGRDDSTDHRVMSVCVPMIHSSGEVIGVLRFVVNTAKMDRQTAVVALSAVLVLAGMTTMVISSGDRRIRTILMSLSQIIDKARMIANGSYGIQIQTSYDGELAELADTVNEMSLKINQNEKVETEFISNLSHELRTPLTAITGWSETLLSGDSLDQGTRRGVRIIHREAARLTEMVLDLLDFTKIQDGRMTLNIEMGDIRGELEDTVFMYGSRLAQDGITLEYTDYDEDIPEIPCDLKRMRQVFLNILDNAAKHGGDGKRIGVDIRCVDDRVVTRIRDYGSGIPEDELPLVKKKFYKGSSKARGTGIGLAVCEEIVQKHGGSLILENALGGGTLVTVNLPIAQ